MTQDFTVPVARLPQARVPATPRLMEKWTGAMLDPTGQSHCGALRLDFAGDYDAGRAYDAVAQTLADHPILAAQFHIDGKTLSGEAPLSAPLRQAIRAHLDRDWGRMDDTAFLAHRAFDPSTSGLRLAAQTSDAGLRIWLGFWIFTCDGASIDHLVTAIARRYRGEAVCAPESWATYAAAENARSESEEVGDALRALVYGTPGPYGMDACRDAQAPKTGTCRSVPFVFQHSTTALTKWARANRVTSFAAVFAAFQRAVSAESGVARVITGVPFANRRGEGEAGVVGPIANTVPVITEHADTQDFLHDARAAQRALISAAGRQHIDTARLYPGGLSTRTSAFELPFPQLFNAHNAKSADQPVNLGEGTELRMTLLPNDTCRVGFEITLDDGGAQTAGRFDLDADAYGDVMPRIVARMAQDLDAVA